MNKQQKEVQQQFLDNEKAILKSLKETYQDAIDEINDKIAILMAREDADMQHVIYQVEYQKALKSQIQGILDTMHANEFESISEYLTTSYEDGFIGTMYDMQAQGVPLVMPIDQEQVIAAIQHETKLSENLYTALGKDVKALQKKISGEISRGIAGGQMFSEIARNISSYAGISRNNAIRIARTEGHRIQCKATADAQWKAKSKGADVVKQWDSALDAKTRPHHRKLDGQIRELDEPFEIAGMKAMFPSDFGRASEDINCRCALLQRARWALEEDIPVTKWSEDAPVLIDDDGTTQFVDMSDSKNYKQFKERYQQQVMQGAQKMNQKGKNNKKTLEKVGKSSTMELEGMLPMDLQFFGGGKDRADKYESNWTKLSLEETVKKFVPNAKQEVTPSGKINFTSDSSNYSVCYDTEGDYFRIERKDLKGKRRYTDTEGNNVSNITVNGKTRGRTTEEYESMTHFKNIDKDGD